MALRVIHLATTAADGAGIAARRIHEALLTDGTVDSRLLLRDPGNTGPGAQIIGQPPVSWNERLVRRLPFTWSASLKQERALNALLAQTGPAPELFSLPHARARPEDHTWITEADVIHLHWVSGFVDYPRFFARLGSPVVWTLHDQSPYLGGFHYELDQKAHPAFALLDQECLGLKHAALSALGNRLLVIGNSRWNTELARASVFFPHGTRFETVYYPLDPQSYAPRNKASAKAALGLDPHTTTVGFACTGLENKRKGLSDLLAALRLLEQVADLPTITLVSFGRPPSDSLRASLRSPWLHLGFLDTDTVKCAAYSAMDCFVIPSLAEAFGQTAIEALASGTCVLGANVGGIPETMPANSHAAALFPPSNPPAIADRLRAVLSAPALRATLAAQGREHVLRQHEPAHIVAQLSNLYTELTAQIT